MGVDDFVKSLDSIDLGVFEDIPLSLVEYPSRHSAKLLVNHPGQQRYEGMRRWLDFAFREELIIDRVEIAVSDFSDFADFEMKIRDHVGTCREVVGRPVEGIVSISVAGLVSSLSFRPPMKGLSSGVIEQVRLIGCRAEKISDLVDFVDDFDRVKSMAFRDYEAALVNLEKREASVLVIEGRRNDLLAQVDSIKNHVSRENGKLNKARHDLLEIQAKISALNEQVSNSNGTLHDLSEAIDLKKEERVRLDRDVADLERTKRSLEDDVNIFPSELSEFVKYGQKNVILYSFLSFIPVSIIVFLTVFLVNGADGMATVVTDRDDVNVMALMVSRMPFVAVSGSIIALCYYLLKILLAEVIRINVQKLNLTKISIVAKDVSSSLENDSEMSRREIYDKRLRLKMDMMRGHLAEYLGKDFQPTYVTDRNRGQSSTPLKAEVDPNISDVNAELLQ